MCGRVIGWAVTGRWLAPTACSDRLGDNVGVYGCMDDCALCDLAWDWQLLAGAAAQLLNGRMEWVSPRQNVVSWEWMQCG